jgi:TetR/AcrR family transcriptional regulator
MAVAVRTARPMRSPARLTGQDDAMTTAASRARGRPLAAESPVSADDILLAALQAFAERGYDGMSVRDLTAQLGVSHNLIFQRFGRKEQLWTAVVDRFFGPLRDLVIDIVDVALRTNVDAVDAYRQVIVTFVEANARRPELPRLMNLEAATEGDRLAYLFEHFISQTSKAMARLDRRMSEQHPGARRIPPTTLFFMITQGATGPAGHLALARRLADEDPRDPTVARRHAEAVADLLLHGIAHDAPPVRRRRAPSGNAT